MWNPTHPREGQLNASFCNMSLEETSCKKEPYDPFDPFEAYSKDIDCQRLTPVPDRDDIRTAKELIAFWRGESQHEFTEEKNPSDERTKISSTRYSSSPPSVSPRSKLKNMCLEDQDRVLNGQPPNQKLIYILKNCSPISWGPKKTSNCYTPTYKKPLNNNYIFPPISQGSTQFSNFSTYSTNYSQHNINYPSSSQGTTQFSNFNSYSTNYSQHNINFPSIPQVPTPFSNFNNQTHINPQINNNMFPPISQGPLPFPNFNNQTDINPQINNNMFPPISQGPLPFPNFNNQTVMNPQINNNMFPHISQGPLPFPNFNNQSNINPQINNNMFPHTSQGPTQFPNINNQTVMNPQINNNMFPHTSQGPTQFPNFNNQTVMNPQINNNMFPHTSQGPTQFPNFNTNPNAYPLLKQLLSAPPLSFLPPSSLPFSNTVPATNGRIHNNCQHNSDQSIQHRNLREDHK